MRSHRIYTMAGIALGAVSTAMLISCTTKKQSHGIKAGLLMAGIATAALGLAFIYLPQKQAKKALAACDLLDESDTELMQQNLSEVLGGNEHEDLPN